MKIKIDIQNYLLSIMLMILLPCVAFASIRTINSQDFNKNNSFYLKVDTGWSLGVKNKVDIGVPKPLVTNRVNSALFDAGLGYHFNKYLRSDIVLTTRDNYELKTHSEGAELPITDGNIGYSNIKALTTMLNIYFDYPFGNIFTPNITAGIGLGAVKYGDVYIFNEPLGYIPIGFQKGATNYNFVWQVGLGILTKLTDRLSLDIGYHYIDFGTLESGLGMTLIKSKAWPYPKKRIEYLANNKNLTKLQANEFLIGLHYDF